MVQISIALQHYYTVRGISRPQYWSGQPFPSPGDLPDPGIEPRSPTLQVDSLPAEPQGSPRILGWVASPFSSKSSQPKDWTRVPCIASGFFTIWAISEAQVVRKPPANAGDLRDVGLIPGLGRSPGEGNDNPLQYPCLENPMDRGAWQAPAHRVAKSQTALKQFNMHTCTHTDESNQIVSHLCLRVMREWTKLKMMTR